MLLAGPRSYLQVFFILAFIFAGISPACKFISGQVDFIEICGFDGVKMVAVDSSQTPDTDHHDKTAKNDCAFCFAQTNLKSHTAASLPVVLATDVVITIAHLVSPTFPTQHARGVFHARGPPITL